MPEFAVNIESRVDNINIDDLDDLDHAPSIAEERAKDVLDMEKELKEVAHKGDEKVELLLASEDPIKTVDKDGKEKKKTKSEICKDIKELENAIGINHKGLSRLTRAELENYLVELLDKAGKTIQEEKLKDEISTVEQVKDAKKDIAANEIVKELKKENEVIKEQIRKRETGEMPVDLSLDQGAEFLYRMNFTAFYLLEKLSVYGESPKTANVVGITDKLANDKVKVLMPIYQRLFVEHKVAVIKYGTPLMELMFYTIVNIGSVYADNAKKKQLIQ